MKGQLEQYVWHPRISVIFGDKSKMYHLLSQTLARAATAAGKQTVSCSAFTVHRSIAVAKQDNTTVPLSESLVILNFSFPHWPKASTVNCFLSCPSPCAWTIFGVGKRSQIISTKSVLSFIYKKWKKILKMSQRPIVLSVHHAPAKAKSDRTTAGHCCFFVPPGQHVRFNKFECRVTWKAQSVPLDVGSQNILVLCQQSNWKWFEYICD